LAEGGDPGSLPGLQPLIGSLGQVAWPKPRLAAFVGSAKGADVSLTLKDGPKLRTLWGYLAWRLSGDEGLALVAEAEAARTSPCSVLMVEVFRLAGPSVILLDELVERARAFPPREVDAAIAEAMRDKAKSKAGFYRVLATDDPPGVDEVDAMSLVILWPAAPHSGRGPGKSPATDAATDGLIRCRNAQRKFRNTQLYVAADESLLTTAREAMRRAMAWNTIGGDPKRDKQVDDRLQAQMTQAQLADARDKARSFREGAVRAVRAAWSHVLFPVESAEPGKAFDLDHLLLTARERSGVPAAVYEKASAKGDGIIKEVLGGETLATRLAELWSAERPHLSVAEIAGRFATYVYLPKLRDRVVLEKAIGDALAKLDPKFAYADAYDAASGKYVGLIWQKGPFGPMPATAVLVRPEVAMAQLRLVPPKPTTPGTPGPGPEPLSPPPSAPKQPTRFFGSVEIDIIAFSSELCSRHT
jgi:hypothetical protein